MKKTFISNIGIVKGVPQSIENIEGADQEQIDLLQTTGIQRYCKSKLGLEDMCNSAVFESLSTYKGDKNDIDAVVFSTTSDSIESVGFDYKKVDKILLDNGIENAFVYGSFLSTCSNLTTSLKTAYSLLHSNDYKKILLVIGDKFKDDSERFMESNESILSDGAAALILSKSAGEFELLHLELKNDLTHLEKKFNVLEFLKNTTQNLKDLWLQILESYDQANVEKVFFGNYNLLAQRGFRGQLKLEKDQMFMDNISRDGHLFSIDVLVNLLDHIENRKSEKTNLFACFTTGYFRWGSFLIKKS